MKREKPQPGERYLAGTVIREDGRDAHRNVMVVFQCAHCPRVGRARFTQLKAADNKKDQRKSCKCLKEYHFENYHRTGAEQLSSRKVREIFDHWELHRSPPPARNRGITPYLANFAWQRHCRSLASKPLAHRREVHKVAQRSVEDAMKMFSYLRSEVLRICKGFRKEQIRLIEAAKISFAAYAAEAARTFTALAPAGSSSGCVFEDAKLYMRIAVKRAESRNNMWHGELHDKELRSGEHRSDFGWVFEALRSMRPDVMRVCFGLISERFIAVCLHTYAARHRRKREFLTWQADEGSARGAPRRARRSYKHDFLPSPASRGRTIGKLFSRYAGVLQRSSAGENVA